MSSTEAPPDKKDQEAESPAVEDDDELLTLSPDVTAKDAGGQTISDLKSAHLGEMTALRNELDELKTKCLILETTKQDELDEIRFKAKQEIDSLNHIINALTNDLSSLRSDYDSRTDKYKELKQKHRLQNELLNRSPVNSSAAAAAGTNREQQSSALNSPAQHNTSVGGASANPSSYHLNITQENENLEEDMRKAKESADMLRAVVLPLETEITTLRTRSSTNEERMKELEKIIEEHNKEKQMLLAEEQRIVSECLSVPVAEEADQAPASECEQKQLFGKYIQLKKYVHRSEQKFIDLEQTHLKAIRQVYSLLSAEQKVKLIPYRSKSKSLLSNKSTSSSSRSEASLGANQQAKTSSNEDVMVDGLNIEQNETICRIEELISMLLVDEVDPASVSQKSVSSSSLEPVAISELNYNYVELLAMYEKEKNAYADLEVSYNQKAKEANKNVENLNKEMNNLATIIDDLRKQYLNMQNQFQFQLDSLIKLNEELRTDLQRTELKNEAYKSESLRLKAENKQFYGEQTILTKDFEEQYRPVTNLDEANRQMVNIRGDMIKLVVANQALNRQHQLSLETIKHLQKTNMQYQRAGSESANPDQMVLLQSLESELERERKVRVEAEGEVRENKSQMKLIKDKSQTLIDSLRQRTDHMEFEQRKLKDENQELTNQISSLKKDAKNSLSVQEDLVRLIQSLQIELNQMKPDAATDSPNKFQVRLQHEDDFKECASCNAVFSMTRRKNRCQHCCKIFCYECCTKTVMSGPNSRPHKVCESCHTLLDKTTAPATQTS